MKYILLSCIALFIFNTVVFAQTAEEKAWFEYMTPGEAHKILAEANGTWTTETTMWMDPSQPPIQSKGKAVNSMIFGDRYQESTFEGTMMGMPFSGKSITGFDNATKKFNSIWIDSMGTGMMQMEGTMDIDTKILELTGTMVDPMTGNKMPVREKLDVSDPNKHLFEMFMTYEGKEIKFMEIIYTRDK